MCHSLVNPKFLVQWTHRLLLNVNSFWGLYTCVFWYIYKLWEQTFCPACVCICVRSLWIIRVFIEHVSIDCQTVSKTKFGKMNFKVFRTYKCKSWCLPVIQIHLLIQAINVLFRVFWEVKIEEFRIKYIQKVTL